MSAGGSRSSGPIIAAIITGIATIIAAFIALSGGGGGVDESGGGGSAQKPDYSDRVGTYTGEDVNKTTGSTAPSTLDLRSIDSDSGNVDAFVTLNTYNNAGQGNLSGTIDEDATMALAGEVYSGNYTWDASLDCRVIDPVTIECTWYLDSRPGNPSGSHEGTMSLTKS